MSGYPTNTDDTIDSRDVIAAIEEAYGFYVEACEAEELEPHDQHMWFVHQRIDGPLGNEDPEMVALVKLAEEASDYAADWQYGVMLIRDSYFEDYARDLVMDCGYFVNVGRDHGAGRDIDFDAWPYRCIDWQQVTRELQQEYTSVDFDGVTYWVRS